VYPRSRHTVIGLVLGAVRADRPGHAPAAGAASAQWSFGFSRKSPHDEFRRAPRVRPGARRPAVSASDRQGDAAPLYGGTLPRSGPGRI